jgi:hypothetical protein
MATRLLSIQQQPAMEFTGEISEAAARSDKLFRIYHFFSATYTDHPICDSKSKYRVMMPAARPVVHTFICQLGLRQ